MARMISLKIQLRHVFDLEIGGPRVHRIDAHDSSRRRSDALDAATRPVIKTKRRILFPQGGNQRDLSCLYSEASYAVSLNSSMECLYLL